MRGFAVLVVGAGVAGAAVATLLGRAGADVTLVERAGAGRSSGSPVDLRGGALGVVRRLGLEAAFRAADTGTQRIVFVDGLGRTVATMPARPPGSADIEIPRATLCARLLDAAGEVAEVAMGDGPASIASDPDGVDVGFASGASRRFDLVIGADGQHSTVRRLAWGPEEAFRTPIGLAVATLPLPPELHVDPADVLLHNEPGASVGIHPAGGRPVASFLFRTDLRDAPTGRAAQVRLVRERYRGVGWRAGELLGFLDDGDLYFDVVSRVRVQPWASGRVTLLGDAASSVTILGEGSSMALLGAAALSDALGDGAGLATALARYERSHRPDAERRQAGAPAGVAFLAPRSRLGIAARDGLVRLRGLPEQRRGA